MRLSFASGYREQLASLEEAGERLASRRMEVASGRRVQKPSDDPMAALAAVQERSEVTALDQYIRAANSVESRLMVTDTVLSDIVTQLTTARSLASGATNVGLNATQREAIASQLTAVRDAIFSDINLTFRGSYVFSGTAARTAPYQRTLSGGVGSYAGNTAVMSVDVDRGTPVAVSFDGSAVLRGSDPTDVFQVLDTLAAAVRAGDNTAIEAELVKLESAFNRVVRVQSDVGNSLALVDSQRGRVDEGRRASQSRLSDAVDANMAEAISGMHQADAAYQAALGAIGASSRLSLMDFLR